MTSSRPARQPGAARADDAPRSAAPGARGSGYSSRRARRSQASSCRMPARRAARRMDAHAFALIGALGGAGVILSVLLAGGFTRHLGQIYRREQEAAARAAAGRSREGRSARHRRPRSAQPARRHHLESYADRQGDDRTKTRRHAESIAAIATRTEAFIQRLLDAASIEAGRLSLSWKQCVVADVLAVTMETFGALAAEKSVTLDQDVGRGDLGFWGDPDGSARCSPTWSATRSSSRRRADGSRFAPSSPDSTRESRSATPGPASGRSTCRESSIGSGRPMPAAAKERASASTSPRASWKGTTAASGSKAGSASAAPSSSSSRSRLRQARSPRHRPTGPMTTVRWIQDKSQELKLPSILVVEDDFEIADAVAAMLTQAGHMTRTARDGAEGSRAGTSCAPTRAGSSRVRCARRRERGRPLSTRPAPLCSSL